MGLSVIGAGFGRTGTMSLKLALEQLGFAPCYHMVEVFSHPEHADVWMRAAEGERVDWEALFAAYRAAVDWPACAFYRELAAAYPEAKVVLTVRDPESWYRSARDTIFGVTADFRNSDDPVRRAQAAMAGRIIVDQTFGGRADDRDHAIEVFERHIEEVKRTIPAERLLTYDVAEGWAPLCRFLDAPVPAEPFPRSNTTEEFRRMVAGMEATPHAVVA